MYAALRHGFETTERLAPLPSPGRGRWREAPDEGPFCEAKRWGFGPIKTDVGGHRPSSVSFADSFPQGKPDPSTAFGGPPPLSGEAPLRRGRGTGTEG